LLVGLTRDPVDLGGRRTELVKHDPNV